MSREMSVNIVLQVRENDRCSPSAQYSPESGGWEEEDDLLSSYENEHTLPGLRAIADYYALRRRGLRKLELAAALARYETDPTHSSKVARRRALWSAAFILKGDPYFETRLLLDC